MTLVHSFILAVVQGITEFLPISSDGHLSLFQILFGLTPSLTFAIFLNTATFISVLFYFRRDLPYFFNNLRYIIAGSVPAAIAGFFLKDQIDQVTAEPSLLPYFFMVTSVFVLSSFFTRATKSSSLTYPKALVIGLVQSLAILPGVSRSGLTIPVGLLLGLSPLEAFKFSFCLLIPASAGALLLDIKNLSTLNLTDPAYWLSFVTAFAVGVIAIGLLRGLVVTKRFWLFGIYTLILSGLLLLNP